VHSVEGGLSYVSPGSILSIHTKVLLSTSVLCHFLPDQLLDGLFVFFVVCILEIVNVYLVDCQIKSVFLAFKRFRILFNRFSLAIRFLKNGLVTLNPVMDQFIDIDLLLNDET